MSQPPVPKLVQLEPPGPYRTPVVEAFLGLMAFQGELPPQACLVLQGGIELRIPLHQEALEKLRKVLNDLAADQEPQAAPQ